MKNNFRTLTSGILTKASTLFPKKDDVYTKNEAASKEELNTLTPEDVGAAPIEHDHSYMKYREVWATLPAKEDWNSVTYGSGKFVAITSYSNIAAYSEDGITWTQTTLPSDRNWDSVTYGNGKFVAIASYSNIAAYSEDGITWTQTTLPSDRNWDSVTYGSGKFVAVVYNSDKAAYSEDGITWIETTLPSERYWQSVTYGNGKFVAVAYNSNKVAYSEDGINWSQTTLPIETRWNSVTYGSGKFVAIASDLDKAACSEDGINWTETTLPLDRNWQSVTYGSGKFVTVASYSDKAAYSEDGIIWIETTLPAHDDWNLVTCGNGKFVAISSSGQVVYSRNGIKWYSDGSTGTLIQSGSVITPEQLGLATESYVDGKTAGLATESYVDEAVANLSSSSGSTSNGPSIIDVVELPTENIDEGKFYRLLTGSLVYNQYVLNKHITHCVDTLPEVGEPVLSGDLSDINNAIITAYYNVSDGSVSGYVTDQLSVVFGVPAGWYPGSVLMSAAGFTFSGVITDILDDPRDSTHRLLLEYITYSYKDSKWTSQKTIGWGGIGVGAEVFNVPFNKAYGEASHAEGSHSHAEGYSSHAEGYDSYAEGDYSHAECYYSHAEGYASHAEGSNSHAEGHSSHAEGYFSHAEGYYSHAEGSNSHAEGYYSHAEGRSSHAVGRSQHVQGEYNALDPEYNPDTPNNRAKYAHIVGNGTEADYRSNAHTLDWNGLGWFAGGLKVGGTGQDDPNAKEIATKEYVLELLGGIENGAY